VRRFVLVRRVIIVHRSLVAEEPDCANLATAQSDGADD
jgi:hypothetical protein